MGRVYAAVHVELGSQVASKVMSAESAADPQQAERVFTEARAVSLIRHESIVRTIDLVRTPDGRWALVMELVDGETLRVR